MVKTMIADIQFKKFNSEILSDVTTYIKEYLNEHKNDNIELIIGTDSQNKGHKTTYSTVIAMYNPGHGAHCIYRKWHEKKEKIRSVRLLHEVEMSLEIAENLKKEGINQINYIDIDINPNPKFKSNEVYQTAKGWVESMGYEVRYKTLCPLVTSAADWIVKS